MRPPAWLLLLACLAALAGLRIWYDQLQPEQLLGRSDPLIPGKYRCLRIVEPLSIVVTGSSPATNNGKSFPVRLAGVRPLTGTHQSVAPGVMLGRLVPPGRQVRLEFDRQRFDQHRMPLAYVLVGDRLINAELVEAGVAEPDPLPGHSAPWQKLVNQAAEIE